MSIKVKRNWRSAGIRDEDAELAPAVWKPLGLCKGPEVGFGL